MVYLYPIVLFVILLVAYLVVGMILARGFELLFPPRQNEIESARASFLATFFNVGLVVPLVSKYFYVFLGQEENLWPLIVLSVLLGFGSVGKLIMTSGEAEGLSVHRGVVFGLLAFWLVRLVII